MTSFFINFVVCAALLVAVIPASIYGVHVAKKHRMAASAVTTLLLVFGIGMRVDPPPPPRIEATERDEEDAKDDEPI